MIYLERHSLAVKVSFPGLLYIPRTSEFGCLDYGNGRGEVISLPAVPASQSCFFRRLLSGRRRSLMLVIFAVVSHCDCYNLWPSLQTPSSPPQMFDFNLVVGKNL